MRRSSAPASRRGRSITSMLMAPRRRSATRSSLAPCTVWSATPRRACACPRPSPRSGTYWVPRVPSRRSFRSWQCATAWRHQPSISIIRPWRRRSISCRITRKGAASTWSCPILSALVEPMRRSSFAALQIKASSGRPDGLGGSVMEPKRIAPRSPRAALEPDHVPVPSRRSRRLRNPLVIMGNAVFTALVLVLIVAGGAVVFGKSRFEAPGPLQEDKIVSIPPRTGMVDIADLLKREGVVDANRFVFIGGVFALKARSDLKAGEYLFSKQASMKDVVETILEGKVVQHQLTIPEGLTSEQIVARLLENDVLSGNIKDVPREGSLLPDGYHFNRGFTREQMLQRMRKSQDRLVREVWDRRNPDLPLKTPDQLVILASIIEKETGKPEERTRIAAGLADRLKQKMELQTEPTIIYRAGFGQWA